MNSLLIPVRPTPPRQTSVAVATPSSPVVLSQSLAASGARLRQSSGGYNSPTIVAQANSDSSPLHLGGQGGGGSSSSSSSERWSSGGGGSSVGGPGTPGAPAPPISALQRSIGLAAHDVDAAAQSLRAYVSSYIDRVFLPAIDTNVRALIACNPALTSVFVSGSSPSARLVLPTVLAAQQRGVSLDQLLAAQRRARDTRYVVSVPAPDANTLLLTGSAGDGSARSAPYVDVDLFEEYEALREQACPEPYATAAHVRQLLADAADAEDAEREGEEDAGTPDARTYALSRLEAFARDPSLLDFLGSAPPPNALGAAALPSDAEILLNFVSRLLDGAVARASRGLWKFADRPFEKACVVVARRSGSAQQRVGPLDAAVSAPTPSITAAALLVAARVTPGTPAPAVCRLVVAATPPRVPLQLVRKGVVFAAAGTGGGSGAGGTDDTGRRLTHTLVVLLRSLELDSAGEVGNVTIKPLLVEMLSHKRAAKVAGSGGAWRALGLNA